MNYRPLYSNYGIFTIRNKDLLNENHTLINHCYKIMTARHRLRVPMVL